jgi:hypothetical protein
LVWNQLHHLIEDSPALSGKRLRDRELLLQRPQLLFDVLVCLYQFQRCSSVFTRVLW